MVIEVHEVVEDEALQTKLQGESKAGRRWRVEWLD